MKKNNSEYTRRRASNTKRKKKSSQRTWIGFCVVLAAIIILAVCESSADDSNARKNQPVPEGDYELVIAPEGTQEIKKAYTGFFVSFNPDLHVPNYVAWTLTPEEAVATGKRVSNFKQDFDVEGSATPADYKNSGFDRGHLAPAADMKWSEEAMSDCHYMTNICPQDHALNGGVWNTLENNCRTWARRDSDLVIIAGPVLTDALPRKIGASGVAVPERFFKVIFAPYAEPPRAIGFVMANSYVSETMQNMAMSVDEVEAITGFDFFSELPDELENEIESKMYYPAWTQKKKK